MLVNMAFSTELSRLTDELIEVIASTSQNDPTRLHALRESSLRRLRNHSFLRTNHFEVYSALDGYEERFRVVNRDGLADALRNRLDALVECSSTFTPDILHLLLHLADQPVQKSSLADLEALKQPEEAVEEPLNWSQIADAEGWDQDRDLWQNVDFTAYSDEDDYPEDRSAASIQSEDTSPSSIEAQHRRHPYDYLHDSADTAKLDQVLESQAWRKRSGVGGVRSRAQSSSVTEFQAVREILFMLSGLSNDLVHDEGQPSSTVQLTHASGEVSKSLLGSINEVRCDLAILRWYVRMSPQIPLLQVFREAIEDRLRSFDKIISSLHSQYVDNKQNVTVSIMAVMNDLEPHLHPLRCLANTVDQLEQTRHPHPFHYLELLFDSANQLQVEGDEDAYKFIGQLFFECFKVYLRPIRLWMEKGELADDGTIFFISSSPVEVPRPHIWADQFNLKRSHQGSLFAPRFLQPAAQKIFTAGKSVVVLKLLGKRWHAEEPLPEPATQIDLDTVSPFIPFSEIFKDMFDQWMQSKHHAASKTLRETLFQKCNLLSELNIIHHVYLMLNGARSDYFAHAIFNNIDILSPHWQDRYNLSEIAREAYNDLAEPHRLTATASSNGSAVGVQEVRAAVRKGLPLVKITYHLPWPLRIVLSDESFDHYQSIFTFLLQLRRANYILTRHRIASDGFTNVSTEQGLFYGIRAKLLWFCNTLQTYLSTLVLGPLGEKFSEDMNRAVDVDDMIMVHSSFTKLVVDEACLGSKLDPIRHAILDIFDLSIRLIDSQRMELERVEEETQELSRLSVAPISRKPSSMKFIEISEEEDDTFLSEQDRSVMMQDTSQTFWDIVGEIRKDLDRQLKFICGGLRGVSRASGSNAAGKWDTLAEMLEVGIKTGRH
ncbi:Spc98 family-domain-containing protein [Xylariaceae sp. FL0255]|nr:Spc98 family-domain-containing protein [Xylariaceae sp. FL0255]